MKIKTAKFTGKSQRLEIEKEISGIGLPIVEPFNYDNIVNDSNAANSEENLNHEEDNVDNNASDGEVLEIK